MFNLERMHVSPMLAGVSTAKDLQWLVARYAGPLVQDDPISSFPRELSAHFEDPRWLPASQVLKCRVRRRCARQTRRWIRDLASGAPGRGSIRAQRRIPPH